MPDILVVIEENADMPTRNINLTTEQDAFVERVIKSGEYQNASEAIRDALRVLQQKRREDSLKLKALRAQIKAGLDAIERGDFIEVAGPDLDEYLEELAVAPGKGAP
jgi:antitoxin ParD1/3/4